jgi:hypothetical protein
MKSKYACGHEKTGFTFINNYSYCFTEHQVWLEALKVGKTDLCPVCFWEKVR